MHTCGFQRLLLSPLALKTPAKPVKGVSEVRDTIDRALDSALTDISVRDMAIEGQPTSSANNEAQALTSKNGNTDSAP